MQSYLLVVVAVVVVVVVVVEGAKVAPFFFVPKKSVTQSLCFLSASLLPQPGHLSVCLTSVCLPDRKRQFGKSSTKRASNRAAFRIVSCDLNSLSLSVCVIEFGAILRLSV